MLTLVSDGASLSSPVYALLNQIKFKLEFLLSLAHLHRLAANRDRQSLKFTLQLKTEEKKEKQS